jgi:hypothetical protein
LTQKLLNVVTLWSSLNDPSDLYENGIVDCLRSLFSESQKMRKIDEKSSFIAVTEILKILDNLLKYVSEFVKKALQVIMINKMKNFKLFCIILGEKSCWLRRFVSTTSRKIASFK